MRHCHREGKGPGGGGKMNERSAGIASLYQQGGHGGRLRLVGRVVRRDEAVAAVAGVCGVLDDEAALLGVAVPPDPPQHLGRLAAEHWPKDQLDLARATLSTLT